MWRIPKLNAAQEEEEEERKKIQNKLLMFMVNTIIRFYSVQRKQYYIMPCLLDYLLVHEAQSFLDRRTIRTCLIFRSAV